MSTTITPQPPTRPEWRLSFVLILAAGAALTGILLAEIVVRFFSSGYFTPGTLKSQSLPYDAALFARAVFTPAEATAKGAGVSYFINKHGYRGRDFSFDKPPGTTRILVYGGSSAFDLLMPEGKDWPHRVEAALRSQGLTQVEVINAGVPGHAAMDSFGRLYAEGHMLRPDVVVLYTAWNDIKLFGSSRPLLRVVKPYAGNPLTDYQNSLDRFFSESSQLYVRLRQRYYSRKLRFHEEGLAASADLVRAVSPVAVSQYRLTIQSFVDTARNAGAIPVLVTEVRLPSTATTDAQKKRIAYHMQNMTHEALVDAYRQTDGILRDVARDKNAPLIDASREMSGQDQFLADHVHLSDAGSQALAGIVAAQLHPLLTKISMK